MKKKSKIINIIVLIIITILVLYFSLKDNFNETIDQISNMNILFVLLSFLLLIIFWIFRAYPMYSFAHKFNKDFKYKDAFHLVLRTQFFNAVTPFATGGQPYQIYYLKKSKLEYTTATGVVLANFIVYQIALILLGLVALIVSNIFNIFSNAQILSKFIALGFLMNTLVIILMFVLSFAKKLDKKVMNFGINVLYRLKLVKDKQKRLDKWDKNINDFHEGALILVKDKKNFIKNIIYNFIALSSLYLIPLFVLYATGDFNSFSAWEAIVSSAYVMLIGSFVPIPGGTGGLEYGFTQFYGNFISGAKLSAIMLIWRFITYYFGMIVGAISLNIKRRKI